MVLGIASWFLALGIYIAAVLVLPCNYDLVRAKQFQLYTRLLYILQSTNWCEDFDCRAFMSTLKSDKISFSFLYGILYFTNGNEWEPLCDLMTIDQTIHLVKVYGDIKRKLRLAKIVYQVEL